jgi:hypothetical protein
MRSWIRFTFVMLIALAGIVQAQSSNARRSADSDREKLIGAWRLVSLQAPGPDGQLQAVPGLTGTLVYTRDGHVSVQIMYPESQSSLTNDYVLNGYEASFGSYEVNMAEHTVTHHVQGSITRGLVGKDLVRVYQISNGRLVIRSVRPDEHWSVTWEHE